MATSTLKQKHHVSKELTFVLRGMGGQTDATNEILPTSCMETWARTFFASTARAHSVQEGTRSRQGTRHRSQHQQTRPFGCEFPLISLTALTIRRSFRQCLHLTCLHRRLRWFLLLPPQRHCLLPFRHRALLHVQRNSLTQFRQRNQQKRHPRTQRISPTEFRQSLQQKGHRHTQRSSLTW